MGFRSVIATLFGRRHGLDVNGNPVWNRNDGTQLALDTDTGGNPILETTTTSGVTTQFTLGASRRVKLTATSTVQASDDGTLFWSTGAITLNLPAGLSPMPVFMVDPPASGSITVTPTGAVLVAGSSSPYAFNRANTPAGGAAVTPYLDSPDQYGVTVAGTAFSALTGNSTDNASLAAQFATFMPLQADGSKQSAAYTFSTADHMGFVWLSAQAADKIFSVPTSLASTTLSVPFEVTVGYYNPGTGSTGRLKLQSAGGSVLNGSVPGTSGTVINSPIFMGLGSTSFAQICAARVISQGTAPGGAFFVLPVVGNFTTA